MYGTSFENVLCLLVTLFACCCESVGLAQQKCYERRWKAHFLSRAHRACWHPRWTLSAEQRLIRGMPTHSHRWALDMNTSHFWIVMGWKGILSGQSLANLLHFFVCWLAFFAIKLGKWFLGNVCRFVMVECSWLAVVYLYQVSHFTAGFLREFVIIWRR